MIFFQRCQPSKGQLLRQGYDGHLAENSPRHRAHPRNTRHRIAFEYLPNVPRPRNFRVPATSYEKRELPTFLFGICSKHDSELMSSSEASFESTNRVLST